MARHSFIMVLLEVYANRMVLKTLEKKGAKEVRKVLSEALDGFMPTIVQHGSEVISRLEQFRTQTLASFDPDEKKDAEVGGYMDVMGLDTVQVPLIPTENSRAGLYVYVHAALVGRPMLDNTALFTYLHNRYQGDIQTTAEQLILASFDVLANAVFRNEGSKTGHLLKSFVVNKVPLILGSLAATSPMYPFNAELCISQALAQVDINVFPTLSGMFDMNSNSSFQDSVRQDFCFACQLHGLLSPAAIETLLGEITYQSLPDEGRYVKESLVRACLEDSERAQRLIGELDNMNGNTGAAAQAIVEVIVDLCRNKETMTLKQICTQLAGKPLSLDVLLLFNNQQKILHPICELLDGWGGYDDDQGEYQPVYEEFGAILLLLLAFVYRYGLTPADLGIRSGDSFVGRLWSKGHLSRSLDDLTEQEKAHLNGWIHGLFDTETGGLGDELLSTCPPQEFYLLTSTLFHQIVLALSTGLFTEDQLKSGLEYLVGVLLLPSLVPAILFLSHHLWTTGGNDQQRAIIRILQLILRPGSISGDASSMLSGVLNIVAKPLEHALRTYQKQNPKSQDVEPLLRALKEHIPLSRRTGAANHSELESWTSAHAQNGSPSGGFPAALRNTVHSLVVWAQNPPVNGMPPSFTHRQILAALKMLGAPRLLAILLEELKTHNNEPSAPIAYDVITAIVCAPDVTNEAATSTAPTAAGAFGAPEPPQRRMTLREALKAEADEWKRLQKTDPVMAETVIRLHRRVEAQMVPPPAPPPMLQPELSALGEDDIALGDAIAAAAAAGDHAVDGMSLDTTGLDGGVDLGLENLSGLASAAGSTGGLDLNDEIFGGLSGGDFGTDFGNWDGMDLG